MHQQTEQIFRSNGDNIPLEIAIVSNYRAMVIRLVNSFKPRDREQRKDFMQSAYLALLYANKNFDPSKNTKFSSYAWTAIKNELIKEKNKIQIYQQLPIDVVYTTNSNIFDYLPDLTERQVRILTLKLMGYTFREIAEMMEEKLYTIFMEYKLILTGLKEQ
jgi:RNA polymerase sigma factor (sigma-70 family)